jgi:hypothetical protein
MDEYNNSIAMYKLCYDKFDISLFSNFCCDAMILFIVNDAASCHARHDVRTDLDGKLN